MTSESQISQKNCQTSRFLRRQWNSKGRCQLFLAVALLFSVLGCGKKETPTQPAAAATPATKQEQLAQKAFSVQQEAFDLLSSIRDQQSAEAAYAGLDKICRQVESLVAEAKKAGTLTPEVKNRILAEVNKHHKEITDKVSDFGKALASNPQLIQSLQPIVQKLNELRNQYDGFIR